MALSNTLDKKTYQGDGAKVNFPIPFDIIADDSAEVDVYIRDESDPNNITETLQVEGGMQDYTLTGASPPTTPFNTTVTFGTPPTLDQKVILKRNLARTQTLDISESGDFPAESLEKALDRVVAQVQSLKEEIDRMPKLRVTEQFGDTTMGQAFANYLLRVNAGNNGFEFVSADNVIASTVTSGLSGQNTASILDSQTNTDVVGASLNSSVYTSAILFGEITRGTTGGHVVLSIRYINSSWVVQEVLQNTDSAHGVTWNITSGGQLQYTSGAEGDGELKYNLLRFTA